MKLVVSGTCICLQVVLPVHVHVSQQGWMMQDLAFGLKWLEADVSANATIHANVEMGNLNFLKGTLNHTHSKDIAGALQDQLIPPPADEI